MSGILSFSVFARPLSQMLYASNKIAAQDTIKKDPNNIIDVHNSLSHMFFRLISVVNLSSDMVDQS